MHGCSSTFVLIVNAEVDPMGGVGVANKTSPRKAAIEKVQAELWQEYGVRDQHKKELEFLEKGGDPLDFKLRNGALVSVKSTLTDQHPDPFVISETKGSFAFTASSRGDSAGSSGRPNTTREPNSADNLMLIDVEHGFTEGGKSLSHPSGVAPSKQSFKVDVSHKTQDHNNSAIFNLPRKAYKRRYRFRPNQDGARSSLTDVNQNIALNQISKLTSTTDGTVPKSALTNGQDDIGSSNIRSVDSSKDLVSIASKSTLGEKINQESPSAAVKSHNQMDSNSTEAIPATGELISAGIECQPSATAVVVENHSSSCQLMDTKSSCLQTGLNDDPNGNLQNRTSHDEKLFMESVNCIKEKKDIESINNSTPANKESAQACQSQQDICCPFKPEEELNRNVSGLKNKVNGQVVASGFEAYGCTQLDSGSKLDEPFVDNLGMQNEMSCDVKHQDCVEVALTSFGSESKLESKIDEDAILREAQIIEVKHKRIAELSIVNPPKKTLRKSQWDYVLEEMAWLANDFAQERIWKLAAASQISCRLSVAYQSRKQGRRSDMDAKTVAHTLAKAVMEFWRSVQSRETSNELEQQCQKNGALSVRAYAVRLSKFIKPDNSLDQAEVPLTPDRISDSRILDLSWEDKFTDENLFYALHPGAGEIYRKTVESHVAHCEKIGNTVQEEVETSACDAAADFEYHDNAYDEGEGETSTYNTPLPFESSKYSLYGQKKRKHPTHSEFGSENKLSTHRYALPAKRPGSTLNVSIPIKRMRTSTRRVISPFTAGAYGCVQLPHKTDVSTCDTNSFHDDRGLLFENSLEVDSAGEFENQLLFHSVEVSTRPKKKKKKANHLNAAYEQRWQVDSSFRNEQLQRDTVKKRFESHQLESNGNSGLLGQPVVKKPKLMRQLQDNYFDTILPSGGSAPSPAASQMSNMSNPNKCIKMLGGRDRGRKAKGLKMLAGQPGSGGSWSLFEDQALVVLVHDLGPNWELVSDAINSTLHFKCIFRKSKECKERHNFLMDGNSGDGAESAEDSGSSQPYPSTLPGIPKGSARQLFQRLQGPMEEDTLKSHFEKIIVIGQKLNYRKAQEPKHLQQPHSSQTVALSQASPNNLNGGHILTPLDLIDADISGADLLSLGYQGPDSSGLDFPNQASASPVLPASGPGARSSLQGSPDMMTGNNSPSSLAKPNPSSSGDGSRPRPGSLPADEQQRLHQQYNKMIPGKNIPQSIIPAPNDCAVRMVTGGNGTSLISGGANRSLSIARPGIRGLPSPSLVNPGGSMVSSGVDQGSSMLKPRESSHTVRPGLNHEGQRRTKMPDLQIPGNSQAQPRFSTPPLVTPSYPLHRHPTRPISPQTPQVGLHHPHPHPPPPNQPPNPQQQKAFSIRLAKERRLQHHLLLQQKKQQLASSSNPMTPHVQPQPQLPVSPPVQNNSPRTSSPPTQEGGIVGNAPAGIGLTDPMVKQRQRPQNQLNRQHPQKRQQQANVVKGVRRANPNGVRTNAEQYVASGPADQSVSSKSIKMTSQSDNSSSRQKSVNQNRSVLEKALQINPDSLNNLQVRDCDTSVSISTEMDKANTLPQVSDSATNTGQVVSTSLPRIREDVSTQQSQSTVCKSQQTQLVQARKADLYGRSNGPRLE